MSPEFSTPFLGLLAQALRQPNGCDPERLKGIPLQLSQPISALMSALLSTDENQMQERLAEMEDLLATSASPRDWLDLGRLAHALYFRQAAEQYFVKSADLAGEQDEGLTESSAYLALGNLSSEDEDWDRAVQFYRKALSRNASAICRISARAG
mgnify:FL=1